MSSNVHIVNFMPTSNRILKIMLTNADYVTLKMRPLAGPLAERSQRILARFMTGVMRSANQFDATPNPAAAAFGTA